MDEHEPADLRHQAEERLASERVREFPSDAAADAHRLVHELQVHQIELELQNEELVRARNELEMVLRRYTELFDFAPIGYLTVAADGTIKEANFAATRLLGQERERIMGRHFASFVNGGDVPSFERFLALVLEADEEDRKNESCELVLGRAPLQQTDVKITASLLDGPSLSALLAVEDVTGCKRAEESLREDGRRKDEFLATLSHELRNPLSPILNSLFLLERAPAGSEQAARALAVIERQSRQLTYLVDDLLDVTRIRRGKIRLVRAPVELGELVHRTIADHRAIFDARGIELESAVSREDLWVDADRSRLVQVLGNLLGNAVKFTTRGGRVVTAVRREGQWAAIVVRDSGVGITPEVRRRLFVPFSQAPQTIDRSRGGLGLGLATVKGLVELHGGEVGVESDGPEHGAEFTVKLPLIDPPAEAHAQARSSGVQAHRVLVIDDNEDAAESLRDVLQVRGHEVEVAYDGRTGLARARNFRPGLVICDIGLPGMDGYEVARAMRNDDALEGTRLVALSGYAGPADVRRSLEAGFDRHLSKPVPVDVLDTILAEVPSADPRVR